LIWDIFQSANNLRYFDLPGAGSKEEFENINRAILCLAQIQPKRGRNPIVTEFILSDYTDFTKTQMPKQKTISVDEWQSNGNQLIYGADVILYVIAPHEGLGRDDENYMYDLLSAQKENESSNVVFALNLHLTEKGEPDIHNQI
jgi:GTPase Era involved in 16S rRNA processing